MVDARAGPGTKSLTKFKSKKIKKNIDNPDKPLKEKIKKKHRSVHVSLPCYTSLLLFTYYMGRICAFSFSDPYLFSLVIYI